MGWRSPSLLFPDVELLLTQRFRTLLGVGVHVSNKIPAPRLPKMVIWNRDGGTVAGYRDRARMRCRVWAGTDEAASSLARQVVALMPTLVDGQPVVYTSQVSGPTRIPDESEQVQFYILFDVHVRGASL